MDGEICRSYREACDKRGLLEDDSQWDKTLEEAAVSQSARSLRALFAVMLHSCSMSNPLALWEKYKDELSEDFLHQTRLQNPTLQIDFGPEIFNLALIALEDKLAEMGGKQLTHYDLPETHRGQENRLATEVLRETSYNMDDLTLYVEENEPKLLADQRSAYNIILDSVNQQKGRIIFLDAPGGTGKTFVTKLLLSKIRQQGKIALAVTSSGIAATLLPGGRTAHSALKLPLNLTSRDTPVCNISKNSGAGEMLKQCSLIIWDECTMAHRAALEALDRTLQYIRDSTEIMGGLTLMLSGDFRQTLPVIPKGTRADEVRACLKSSRLWRPHVETLALSTNMRAQLFGDHSSDNLSESLLERLQSSRLWRRHLETLALSPNMRAQLFAKSLLELGNGEGLFRSGEEIRADAIGSPVTTLEDLKNKVFPNLRNHYTDHSWLCERAILAPINTAVHKLNADLLTCIPGDGKVYKSIDTVTDPNKIVHYPTEFLNSLEPTGMPSHRLELKIGTPIMLIRNMHPPKLCNGTRLRRKNEKNDGPCH